MHNRAGINTQTVQTASAALRRSHFAFVSRCDMLWWCCLYFKWSPLYRLPKHQHEHTSSTITCPEIVYLRVQQESSKQSARPPNARPSTTNSLASPKLNAYFSSCVFVWLVMVPLHVMAEMQNKTRDSRAHEDGSITNIIFPNIRAEFVSSARL